MKSLLNFGLLIAIAGLSILPAQSQTIKKNALDRAQWYVAPRQIQIIDDRPVINDFRAAPPSEGDQSIPLPPPPKGMSASGGGAGALGAGGAGSSLPAGGLQLGGPNQGFRTPSTGLGSLPKSGFGGSNVPAAGFAHSGLPGVGGSNIHSGSYSHGGLPAVSQGGVGKVMNQNKGFGGGSGGAAPMMSRSNNTGRSNGNYSAPAVQSYSGGYGSGSGSAYGGSSSRTESLVRGTLLRSK